MELTGWDQELNRLTLELQSLLNEQEEVYTKIESSPLLGKEKIAVLYSDFLSSTDKVQNILKQTDLLVGPLSQNKYGNSVQALFYWGGIFLERLKYYWAKRDEYLFSLMWINLIRARLTSKASLKIERFLSDENIVEMTAVKNKLIKKEKNLDKKLEELEIQKKELHKKYQDFLIKDANKRATNEMQGRLGQTYLDAATSHDINTLEYIFKTMVAPLNRPIESFVIKEQVETLDKNARLILGRCRSIAVESNGNPSPEHGSVKEIKPKLDAVIKDLHHIEKKMGMIGAKKTLVFAALLLGGCFLGDRVGLSFEDVVARRGTIEKQKISQMVCLNEIATAQKLWKRGIFDAQIEIQFVQPERDGDELTEMDLINQAKLVTRKLEFSSYLVGKCSEKLGWIASFPAPESLNISQNVVRFSNSEFIKYCKEIDIRFAATRAGEVERINAENGLIELEKYKNGTIGIVCQPKNVKKKGPVLWYLIPTSKRLSGYFPSSKMLSFEEDFGKISKNKKEFFRDKALAEIAQWINSVRLQNNRNPINFSKEILNKEISKLSHVSDSRFLKHDRVRLREVAKTLKESGIALLGENRAKAAKAKDILWLFWNSPHHRQLLLSEKSNCGSVDIKKSAGQWHAMTIFAQCNML